MNYERIPELPTIEDSIVTDVDTLTELLCEYYEHNRQQPLVDELSELNQPNLIVFPEMLNNALIVESEEGRHAVYNAFHFALYSAKLLGWNLDKPVDLYDYFDKYEHGVPVDELSRALVEDAQEYLKHKVVLQSLISSFIPEMRPVHGSEQVCETVAALTFMQIEKSVVSKTDEGMASGYAGRLAAWDGVLPDDWQ